MRGYAKGIHPTPVVSEGGPLQHHSDGLVMLKNRPHSSSESLVSCFRSLFSKMMMDSSANFVVIPR